MRPESGSGSWDPDPSKIKTQQNSKCKWLRIRTWSGSANHTKTNANAYWSGPESRFKNFYADPRLASDPYHTVRIPSSGYNRATNSSYVGVTRHLGHLNGPGNAMPWVICGLDHTIQVRYLPNSQYHLLLPFMVISWTHTVWKGIHSTVAHEFGTTVRMPRCLR